VNPILILLFDTLGAGHMDLYGYRRPTTPFLRRLAEEATTYERCFSSSPWTVPSHASLFTGLYPSQHGLDGRNVTLPEWQTTLPRVMRECGYATVGMSCNEFISVGSGFERGFDRFYEAWRPEALGPSELLAGLDRRPAGRWIAEAVREAVRRRSPSFPIRYGLERRRTRLHPVTDCATPSTRNVLTAIREVLSAPSAGPVFLFANLMQTHARFGAPEPFAGTFVPRSHPLRGGHDAWFGVEHHANGRFDADALEVLAALYDEEILFIDACVRDLVGFLKERRLWDATTLIITSDHGECFGEHGLVEHAFGVYNTNIHIPLLVKYPGGLKRGERDDGICQLQDLYATCLDLAEAPFPRPRHSTSLLATERRKLAVAQVLDVGFRIAACRSRNPGWVPPPFAQPCHGIVNRQLRKVIAWGDGSFNHYDLTTDPGEERPAVAPPQGGIGQDVAEAVADSLGYAPVVPGAEILAVSGGPGGAGPA